MSAITSLIRWIGRVQFLGDDLRERRADVLADLDLAGVDGDRAVFADVQPGADLLRPALTAAAARLLSAEPVRDQQCDDQAAAGDAEEIAAGDFPIGVDAIRTVPVRSRSRRRGRRSLAPPFIARAAFSIAATIRA